jgi:O-antigen ligase
MYYVREKYKNFAYKLLLPIVAGLYGYLLVYNPRVFIVITVFALFAAAVFSLNTEKAYLLLLLSVSTVIVIVQLPFSDFTYIRFDDVAWGILLLVVMRREHLTKTYDSLKKYSVIRPLIIFSILAAISLLRIVSLSDNNVNPILHSIWFQLKFMQCVIIFIFSLLYFPIEKRDLFFKSVIFLGTILAVIGILQFAEVIPLYEYHQLNKFSPGQISSVLSPNSEHLGIYMITALFLSYGMVEISKKNTKKSIVIVAIALMFFTLILTGSRSSWVGFLVGNIVFIMSMVKTRRKFGLFLIIVLVLIGVTISSSDLRELLLAGVYNEHRIGSAMHRVNSYSRFFEVLKSNPMILLVGVGFMNWRYTLVQSTEITWAHNNYLSVLGELGIGGFLVFLWYWFSTLNISRRLANAGDIWAKCYNSILTAILVACLSSEALYPVWSFENLLLFIMTISGVILSPYRYRTISQ